MTGAMLSIRPRFAKAILNGVKRVELRRRAPACVPGELVVVYETSPTMAIVGIASVAMVTEEAPAALWPIIKDTAAISHTEFRRYFAGRDRAYCIYLEHAVSFEKPVSLAEARKISPTFRPPQSWCYLESLPKALMKRLTSVAGRNISNASHLAPVPQQR